MSEILRANVDDDLDELETPAEDIVAGEPRTRAKALLHHAGDATRGISGIFVADPGSVRTVLEAPETYHVLEGSARFESGADGTVTPVEPGDVAVFPAGEWVLHFETRFKAVFVLSPTAAAPRDDA